MAYSDLINNTDVAFRADLNNSFTPQYTSPTLWGTATGNNTSFIADHPFDSSKQSLKISEINGYNPYRYYFGDSNYATTAARVNYIAGKQTTEFWFKYSLTAGTNAIPALDILKLQGWGPIYGEQNIIAIGLDTSGKINYTTRSDSAATTSSTGFATIPAETWTLIHIDLVGTYPQIYINGICDSTPNILMNGSVLNANLNVNAIWLGGVVYGTPATDTFKFAELVVYNKVLSKEEKAARYMYGKADTYVEDEIIASAPKIFWKLDNPDKSTTVPNYGTASNCDFVGNWSASQGTNITVNQAGVGNKGWKLKLASPNVANAVSSSSSAAAVTQQIIGGQNGWSIELFLKIPARNSGVSNSAHRILDAFAGGSGGQYQALSLDTGSIVASPTTHIGHPDANIYYWTGTAWQSGSMATYSRSQWRNVADDNWHHIVYRMSHNGTSNIVSMYLDGCLARQRTLAAADWSTASIPVAVQPYSPMYIGHYTSATDDGRDFTLDNFAVYDRVLSEAEIQTHYLAWLGQPSQRIVKYFDGTNWVNSTAQKVWNGTQWVSWNANRYNGTSWVSV